MKTLHILSYATSGGASLACFRLHEALLRQNFDSKLLMLDPPPINIKDSYHFYPLYEAAKKHKTLFHRIISKIKYIFGLSHEARIVKERAIQSKILHKKTKRLEVFTFPMSNYDIKIHPLYEWADIIHLHFVAGGFIDYGTFFRENTKKVVWTLHDMNPFTGGCHFSGDCNEFQTDCRSCPELFGTGYDGYAMKMLRYKNDGLLNHDDLYIVSPSLWLKAQSEKSRLMQTYQHYHIPYGIDSDVYMYQDKMSAKQQLGLNTEKRYYLFNAFNLKNVRKGVRFLLDALQNLHNEDNEIELIFLGNCIEEFSVDKFDIRYPGFIKDQHTLALYYQASDLFVMPSIADNLPNVVLESIMCGTPVMAFNVGGVPDMIDDGKNGILIDDISAQSLNRELKTFTLQKKVWEHQKIAEEAAEKYDYATIANQYIKLYTEIDSSRG